jgi:hypothetical protein
VRQLLELGDRLGNVVLIKLDVTRDDAQVRGRNPTLRLDRANEVATREDRQVLSEKHVR